MTQMHPKGIPLESPEGLSRGGCSLKMPKLRVASWKVGQAQRLRISCPKFPVAYDTPNAFSPRRNRSTIWAKSAERAP